MFQEALKALYINGFRKQEDILSVPSEVNRITEMILNEYECNSIKRVSFNILYLYHPKISSEFHGNFTGITAEFQLKRKEPKEKYIL